VRLGRRIGPWLVSWIALFWLWMLLAGDWNRIEWIAGICIATVGSTLAELLRTAAGVQPRVPLGLLRSIPKVALVVLVDFGIVVWALIASLTRREVVRGEFRAHGFDPGDAGPDGVAHRAWTVLLAGYSPNAYVVDVDTERRQVLLHDLVPFRQSEEPA
jgi:hypothetical protein